MISQRMNSRFSASESIRERGSPIEGVTSEGEVKSAFTMTWEPPTGADVQMFFEKVLRGENAGTPRRNKKVSSEEKAFEAEKRADYDATRGDGRREGGGTREARQAAE
jgi:hypothetical protein